MPTTDQHAPDRVVICRAGNRRFALPGAVVREVCTDLKLVRMPGVALPVEGVVNLRGTLVTVVRAEAILSPGPWQPGSSEWCVVVRFREGRVGLGVDEVVDFAVPGGLELMDVDALLEPVFRSAPAPLVPTP